MELIGRGWGNITKSSQARGHIDCLRTCGRSPLPSQCVSQRGVTFKQDPKAVVLKVWFLTKGKD